VPNFLGDDVFDPGTVSILMAAFDGAWQSIKTSGAQLSEKQSELVRQSLPSTSLNRLGRASLTRFVCATAHCFTWLNQI
jgi:hypothetical protein